MSRRRKSVLDEVARPLPPRVPIDPEDIDVDAVNIHELSKRILLRALVLIEAGMTSKSGMIPLKDKWELSLKSMHVIMANMNKSNELVGTKETEAVPKSVEDLNKEIREKEVSILQLFERRKRRRLTQREAAEEALEILEPEDLPNA